MNWEDPISDLKALNIKPGNTLFTIISGGCNTLGFLLRDPKIIYSVDINQSQGSLLEIKMEAMKALDYYDYVKFLGINPMNNRLEFYNKIRLNLTHKAQDFWDHNNEIIKNGLLFYGRYDRFVRLVGKLVRLLMGRKRVIDLFNERDALNQKKYFEEKWNIRRTHWIFDLFFTKRMLTKGGLEPEYFHFDDGADSFADSFYRRFKKVLSQIPIKNNYFLNLYLLGRYRSLEEVPDYLCRENYDIIKSRLDRIKIVIDDAKKWLAKQPENTIDAFSLSNICELMSLDDTEFLFREVLRTAKPGAGICFRNLMIKREVPNNLKQFIVRNEILSNELLATDRSFVYGRVDAMEVKK